MKNKKINMIISALVMMAFMMQSASAYIMLDSVSFDPAIITAGDEVTIIASMHSEGENFGYQALVEEDIRYTQKAILVPYDSIAKENVIVIDDGFNNNLGIIDPYDKWNSQFRIKVLSDAPVGQYKMSVQYKYYLDGEPIGDVIENTFYINVKKEGIIAGISNMNTNPLRVRPGDDFVELTMNVENSGEKNAKNMEIVLSSQEEGMTPSYANNNRVWVGVLNTQESKQVTFTIDVTDDVLPDTYDLEVDMSYMDLDNNKYTKTQVIPILIKERPQLEVVSSVGTGLSGSSTKLKVTVKNTGTETAEFVDARILKQSSQTFDLEARSSYIGDLEPGEEGVAIFNIDIAPDTELKEHDVKLILRAKGDSDKGDDNIYTFSRRATLTVDGVAPNLWKTYGSYLLIVFMFLIVVNKVISISKKKTVSKKKVTKK